MFENLLLLLGAPAGSAGTGTSSSSIASFLPFILIFVVMYFLIIRPQSKKQKTMKAMLANLSKGDAIVTAGGIHGVIVDVKEKTIIVKIDSNIKIEFEKASISTVKVGKQANNKKDSVSKEKTTKDTKAIDSKEKTTKNKKDSDSKENTTKNKKDS